MKNIYTIINKIAPVNIKINSRIHADRSAWAYRRAGPGTPPSRLEGRLRGTFIGNIGKATEIILYFN